MVYYIPKCTGKIIEHRVYRISENPNEDKTINYSRI